MHLRIRSLRNSFSTHLVGEALEYREVPTVLPMGVEFRVNDVTAWQVDTPAVALDGDGDFVVAWQAYGADGSNNAVIARRYSKDGTAIGGDFQVNTFVTGSQQFPQVAADAAGNFIVVWGSASAQDGSREGVYARRYGPNGQPLSGEFLVNQFTLNIQGNASVAMDDAGDFVIAWESNYQDGDGYAIYARRYNSAGVPVSNEFRVNTITIGDQRYPAVAMQSNGAFVITWQSPDSNLDGVFARQYNSAGQPIGPVFPVNTTATDDQTRPRVAVDTTGVSTIIWESRIQDAGTSGIYGRRFNGFGQAITPEFRVNSYTTGDQVAPRIASSALGELVATWQSNGQDGDSGGIYALRFGADGAVIDGEMRIHTTTTGNQTLPAVGSDISGDFVVAWASTGVAAQGIYSQRYMRPPAPHADVIIDDGNEQRSSIQSVTLVFNTLATIEPNGVNLTGPQGISTLNYDTSASTPTQSIVRINFSGNNATSGGLINGYYTLTLYTSGIKNLNDEGYDGDGDGVPGPSAVVQFHRLFGDINGDRAVNSIDFAAFRLYFGLNSSFPSFRHYFDADGDGDIDSIDFAAFRSFFGLQMP